MVLPPSDLLFLAEKGLACESVMEGGVTCLVFPGFPLPPGYGQSGADLLVRLMPGYPDVAPDMWWFSPPLQPAGGAAIQGTELTEAYLGRQWQRWSRHFQPGQWKSGVDGLESFLALIRSEIDRCAGMLA